MSDDLKKAANGEHASGITPSVRIRVPDLTTKGPSAAKSKPPARQIENRGSHASLAGFLFLLAVLIVIVLRTSGPDEADLPPGEDGAMLADEPAAAPTWMGESATASRASDPEFGTAQPASAPTISVPPNSPPQPPVHVDSAGAAQTTSYAPRGILQTVRYDSDERPGHMASHEEAAHGSHAAIGVDSLAGAAQERINATQALSVAKAAYDQLAEMRRAALSDAERRVIDAGEKLTYLQNKFNHAVIMVRKGHLAPARRDSLQFPLDRARLEYQDALAARDRLASDNGDEEIRLAALRRDAAAVRLATAEAAHQLFLSQLASSEQPAAEIETPQSRLWPRDTEIDSGLPVITSARPASALMPTAASTR